MTQRADNNSSEETRIAEANFTSFFRGRVTRAQQDSLAAVGGFRPSSGEEG